MRFFAFLLLHLLSFSTVSAEESLPPIYDHDAFGNEKSGSLSDLIAAARDGKRIRVQYRSENGDFLWVRECNHVAVEVDKSVTCFVFLIPDTQLSAYGLEFMSPLYYEHQIFRTTGAYSGVKFSVENGNEISRETAQPRAVTWFAH
ncbi:hypothetical protein GOE00_26680 [Sinorhizobium medicae]|uniref:hypothetical protein n=1 Tax=Sinorhizobium medicae TaxID=110321 RepID=UPI001AACC9BC|nr:hypothetical protein [Sinorhizobium medicae]MBO1944381.1 hypothetical protein [Sinorhizobium medicae]MDX0870269.1 hypothetical protein [Sinorhizobium medicae]